MPGEPATYLTLKRDVETREMLEVKRSKFLAVVRRVDTEDEAREMIADLRREFRDARHHCTAFVLGARGEVTRSNDDGEPSGTAGAPMLEVLRGAELSDVCAVVVRWFGGTLLGAGGLVRAYSDAVTLALASAPVVRREERMLSRVSLPHAEAGRVESELRSRGIEVLDAEYSADVSLLLASTSLEQVEVVVAEATSGTSAVEPAGVRWIDRAQ
ncbi:MAG: YigZ family protein [Gordonia sp. (in: high G+C Gram-positive bacteria)]|uniref:YigZ family protein n=1 Tax=Gordonia sp. (in: high G+C Gram-positive bacteria) TaxID=84139 RepID=UPI003C78A09D